MNTYELAARYDSRKSFYNKARIEEVNGVKTLYSYGVKVASISGNTAEVYGTYSQTTLRHIKEFLKQHDFRADNKAQIEADYIAA